MAGYSAGKSGIDLTEALADGETVSTDPDAMIYAVKYEGESFVGAPIKCAATGNVLTPADGETGTLAEGIYFVDFYVKKTASDVAELQIDASNFAGYYYVEGSTLFRRQDNGVDMPAEITFPNVKIQSNFTFAMAATGDPSTFTFTMDAMPGYTYFNKKKKVLCAIQIVNDNDGVKAVGNTTSVFPHDANAEA